MKKFVTMKKHWYYVDEQNERHGPMSLDEIKLRRILKSTLIWNETMKDWERAENCAELKEILVDKTQPPPVSEKINSGNRRIEQNDEAQTLGNENTSVFTSNEALSAIWVSVLFILLSSAVELFLDTDYFKESHFKKGLIIILMCWNFYQLFGKHFRNYLNSVCRYNKANNFLGATVFSFLAISVMQIFYDFDTLFESEEITFIMFSIIVLMLVYVISYIGLSLKLLFMNNDYSGLPRLVGGSMAFSSIYLIYMVLNDFTLNKVEPFSSENLWYLFIFNLPYFIMIFMFFTTKEKLTDKKS